MRPLSARGDDVLESSPPAGKRSCVDTTREAVALTDLSRGARLQVQGDSAAIQSMRHPHQRGVLLVDMSAGTLSGQQRNEQDKTSKATRCAGGG